VAREYSTLQLWSVFGRRPTAAVAFQGSQRTAGCEAGWWEGGYCCCWGRGVGYLLVADDAYRSAAETGRVGKAPPKIALKRGSTQPTIVHLHVGGSCVTPEQASTAWRRVVGVDRRCAVTSNRAACGFLGQ